VLHKSLVPTEPAVSLAPPPVAMRRADGAKDGDPGDRVDVAVIGGGINGTGVARDFALRGLKVALFERNDLAFGASGNSSGMIHGGVRYLSQSPQVTKTSCRDSGYIQRIAPHLLFRIPFLMPLRDGAKARIAMELVDAYFRAYDDYQPLKRGEPHCRLDSHDLAELEPGLVGGLIGGVTFDEWGVDGVRLCVHNAVDAIEHGSRVFVHTTVESIARSPSADDPHRYVVSGRDRLRGHAMEVRARVVVNATGAWSPITAALGGLPQAPVRVRPGKGIHVVLDRRITNYGILSEAIDGRQVFLEPWQNVSVLGTTDDDYYGDLDDVRATSEEVRYLVQGVARTLPGVRLARAIGTYAGVRPTLYEYGRNEDALSRDHRIVDHGSDGAAGLYSMIGGKLASYRLFAQELCDHVAPSDFGNSVPCSTHTRPLPGGERIPDAGELGARFEITPVAARRLVYRHGERALRVLDRTARCANERDTVCPCEPVLEAEVRYVVREELARTVADVARRTRLGLGACGGMRCAARCGQIVTSELHLTPSAGRAMALEFLDQQARSRVVALGPEQARQEALLAAHVRSSLGDPP
jgi:glycerol-3-phosphate dehydrogenase